MANLSILVQGYQQNRGCIVEVIGLGGHGLQTHLRVQDQPNFVIDLPHPKRRRQVVPKTPILWGGEQNRGPPAEDLLPRG
jgi:hypothetical protein